MGIVTIIFGISFAYAQNPDWNRQVRNGRELPDFLDGSPEGIGLGLFVGAPISLAGSYYKNGKTTQLLFGMWFPNTYRISLDQVQTIYSITPKEYISLHLNVGLGGFAYFNEYSSGDFIAGGGTTYDHYGIRAPVNIAFNHSELAFDIYVEMAPCIQFTPQLTGELYGGIGMRVYPFHK